jgi:hypothetical protein
MSLLGHKRTSGVVRLMSAFTPKSGNQNLASSSGADGVVFRTKDESSWDSLEQYKESKHRETVKATEATAEVELA